MQKTRAESKKTTTLKIQAQTAQATDETKVSGGSEVRYEALRNSKLLSPRLPLRKAAPVAIFRAVFVLQLFARCPFFAEGISKFKILVFNFKK